jgi:hypothetical protein
VVPTCYGRQAILDEFSGLKQRIAAARITQIGWWIVKFTALLFIQS